MATEREIPNSLNQVEQVTSQPVLCRTRHRTAYFRGGRGGTAGVAETEMVNVDQPHLHGETHGDSGICAKKRETAWATEREKWDNLGYVEREMRVPWLCTGIREML